MHAALHRLLFRSAIALTLLAAAPMVSAQTLTLPQVLSRKQPFRNSAQKPFWISRNDCLQQDELSFVVNMVSYQGYSLQVWAGDQGTDCTAVNQRQSGGSATCWLVFNATPTVTPFTVTVKAVDIVGRNTPDVTPENNKGFPDACNQTSTPLGQQLTLYFMFVNAGTMIYGTPQQWTNIGYDLSAPAPPSGLSAAAGETRLHLTWSGTNTTDTVTTRFYCDPPTGSILPDGGLKTSSFSSLGALGTLADTGGATGLGGGNFGLGGVFGLGGLFGSGGTISGSSGNAGDTATSGGAGGTLSAGGAGGTSSTSGGAGGTGTGTDETGGTTSVATSCSSTSVIQPGEDPVYPKSLAAYECGSVSGAIATSGTADHLVNNVNYVVAVSAVDLLGNASPLSSTACATPVEVTDFFELYKNAGGKAGGGICSLSRIPNPGGRSMLAALGVLAGVGVVRRVRRRQR